MNQNPTTQEIIFLQEAYARKQRWHAAMAALPAREKMRQLLKLQAQDLALIARHRPLKWYERPWPVEP